MQGLTPYNLKIVAEVLSGKAYPLALLDLLGDSPLVVDIGANIGSFSLACHVLRSDVRLLAVEPDPVNFSALKENLAMTNADLYQAALSDRDGEIDLFLGDQDSVANSTFAGKMASGQRRFSVKSLATKTFLETVVQQKGAISLIKSDSEGGEWYLLDLDEGFLATIPIIFLEYHSALFLSRFLPKILQSHVIYSGMVRFPHRGELAFVAKNWVSEEQNRFEIRPN